MAFDVQLATVTVFNSDRLHEDIAAVVPTFIGIRNMSGSIGITLVFQPGTSQADIDEAIAIAETHNPNDLSTGNSAFHQNTTANQRPLCTTLIVDSVCKIIIFH